MATGAWPGVPPTAATLDRVPDLIAGYERLIRVDDAGGSPAAVDAARPDGRAALAARRA